MRSGGSNVRENKAMRPPRVTRDTGALNEDLESEFVRIGKPWLCTATKVARWDEAPGPGIYGADTRAPRTQR